MLARPGRAAWQCFWSSGPCSMALHLLFSLHTIKQRAGTEYILHQLQCISRERWQRQQLRIHLVVLALALTPAVCV